MKYIELYHYRESGLDNIYLRRLVQGNDEGDILITVPIQRLHAHIAKIIISKGKKINGREIRFLRTQMGLTYEKLAEKLEVRESDLVKWERGKEEVKDAADKKLRILMFASLVNEKSSAVINPKSDSKKITLQAEEDDHRRQQDDVGLVLSFA